MLQLEPEYVYLWTSVFKLSVVGLALVIFGYFYMKWNRIKHSTTLFSYYTTTKIMKKGMIVWTGLLLFFVAYSVETATFFYTVSYARIFTSIMQALGIAMIGYAFYLIYRREMPVPMSRKEFTEHVKIESVGEGVRQTEKKKTKTKRKTRRKIKKTTRKKR